MIALRRYLTPRRLRYAWLTGAILWISWLISILFGPGRLDLAGQAVGTDYVPYYAAGYTVRVGESARLYDLEYQAQLEHQAIGPGMSTYHAAITPPFLAWLFVPFSLLPYGLSFALWSILSLLSLYLSLILLRVNDRSTALLWSLTWFPIFAVVSFGQNTLMTVLLLSLTYRLWSDDHPFFAGLACSLALYKPQLLLGVALLWLLDIRRSWPALAGLSLGGGLLALLCFSLLPDASWAYVDFALNVLPDLPSWQSFPMWHLHTVRGFWRLLLPARRILADSLTMLVAAIACYGFVRLWLRFRDQRTLLFAMSVVLTMVLTPHAMVYDLAVWLIPAVLLVDRAFELTSRWRALYALVWLVTLLGSPLTFAQLQVVPVALQVSVPALLYVSTRVYQELMGSRSSVT